MPTDQQKEKMAKQIRITELTKKAEIASAEISAKVESNPESVKKGKGRPASSGNHLL